ncbi:MAG: response regulator [Bacteroidales bacterium]|jgi:CheY-like chemotaxis protein|nr:response regulator [Bacteroidales bacterium]
MTKYNILIVDDIFLNRLLLKEFLKNIAEKLIEAENGKDAIEIIKNNPVDVVLMDIEMPVMNGLETTKFIRNNFPEPSNRIPIIALTAHNPDDFFNDFNSAGFDELLTKPYSFEKVLGAIKKARS